MKNEIGRTEYHYGFYGAVHASYEPTNVKMQYLQEHELGDEPVRMDMLILKQDTAPLTDPVGSFFKTHNVLEYKSPADQLSVKDFYKVQAYALLYHGLSSTGDPVSIETLTVSIFRHTYPRKMFRELENGGFRLELVHPGVYHVKGAISVPAQIVITSRLPKGEYEVFKVLAKDASKEDILKVLKLADESTDPKMIDYIRAVMNVSASVNEALIKKIKEDGTMNQAVRRIFKEELAQERQEGKLEGRQEGLMEALASLVKKGLLSLSDAAKEAGMSPDEFQMKTAGMK